jgi:diguanylate cyclase (GGDEF)-like protein
MNREDDVVDALGGILRDFGRYSFDLARQEARRTQTVFDQWAQHVVAGVEAPEGVQKTAGRRDYPGVRRAFARHRQAELAEVSATQESLREVVWAFVGGLNRLVTDDAHDDEKMTATLSQLAFKLGTSPAAELRTVAIEAVSQVRAVFETRRKRQRDQMHSLAEKLETLGSQLETARKESTTDGLTRLYNRRAFDEHLAKTSELAQLRDDHAALLMVDIDHFKKVNDTWGHAAGDEVLVEVSSVCVRTFNRKGDFVARYGGEELAVVVRAIDPQELGELAERLRKNIEAHSITSHSPKLQVTVSIGGALFHRAEAPSAWLARADRALYAAKRQGRNRVELEL